MNSSTKQGGFSAPSANVWALVLHLSQFAGYLIPFGGFIVPILIWQLKKDTIPGLDQHGRIVANWILSDLIYAFICFLLTFVLIGYLGLILLGLLSIAFPVMGAIKAYDGVPWRYPGSLRIF